ncbi:hypothetical protein IWZ00DRAFT_542453 [Phyllosticta capitalensis]|uniref:uncharacterized protein n=1 Tax=Phyllosticta capitalensis TaxID=121624 RepID=UPI00313109C1
MDLARYSYLTRPSGLLDMLTAPAQSSLTQEEIPIKLRCAICNKLVINAFGLPCCDQSICENCQSSLPDACPVCSHSPLSAEDCKPKKNLRLTVKAYLKSEEKKRDKERSLSISGKPGTPVTPGGTAPPVVQSIEQPDALNQPTPTPQVEAPDHNGSKADETVQVDDNKAADNATSVVEQTPLQGGEVQEPAQEQNPSIDEENPTEEPSTGITQDQEGQEQGEKAQEDKSQEQNATWNAAAGGQAPGQAMNGNFGFDQNPAAFGSMNWGPGGFNPMMMNGMPGMQNGNWNNFGMMGMPGMGVDPMAMSQGMFGGFGGQGMGMNGMNMGMGYGGGYGGGWNGQQLSGNDFGGANAGYYPGGGYNQQSHQQGHFPQMNHRQQQFAKNNFQNQNRFPGPGTFGQQQQQQHQETAGQGQQEETEGVGEVQEDPAVADHPSGPDGQNDTADAAKNTPDTAEATFVDQLPVGMGQDHSTLEAGPFDLQPTAPTEPQQNDAEPETQETPLEPNESGHAEVDGGHGASDTNTAEARPENPVDEPVDQPATTPAAEQSATTQDGPQQEQGMQQAQNGFHPPFQPNPMGAFSQAGPMGMNMAMGPMGPMGPMDSSYMAMGGMQGMQHDTPMGWNSPYDFSGRGRGRGFGRGGYNSFRGGYTGRGGPGFGNSGAFSGEVTVLAGGEPKGVGVEGAPTGPRAMREGLPNTGASGRLRSGFGPGGPGRPGWTPSESVAPTSVKSKSPERERSRSASQSRPKSKSRSPDRSRSRSPSRRHRHRHRHRSQSASEETDRERRDDKRRHRRRYEDEEDEAAYEESRYGGHSKDRTREPSVEDSSRHRSRRDREKEKDRHRSSRHRDRSHEHRRHRHRSRTPTDGRDDDASVANGDDFSSESGRRSKRDKYRDRDSDYEKEWERRKEKERERDREKEKDRKRSRRERERSASPSRDHDDYEDEDRHHRSSRRRREKEKEKDRAERAARKEDQASGSIPEETEFKIQGRSRDKLNPPSGPSSMMPPPTGPKAMTDAPKGPSRHRDRDSSRRNSVSQGSATSSHAAAMDPITLEREARNRERMLKEVQRRASLHHPSHKSSSGSGDKRKRGGDATEDKEIAPPTGPSADREKERDRERHGSSSSKRRRGSDAAESKDSERSNGHSHGHSHRKQRRLSYKYEDEENDEARARRVESEREAQRWR